MKKVERNTSFIYSFLNKTFLAAEQIPEKLLQAFFYLNQEFIDRLLSVVSWKGPSWQNLSDVPKWIYELLWKGSVLWPVTWGFARVGPNSHARFFMRWKTTSAIYVPSIIASLKGTLKGGNKLACFSRLWRQESKYTFLTTCSCLIRQKMPWMGKLL